MKIRDPQGERWSVRRRWWLWRRRMPGAIAADQPGERMLADPTLDRSVAFGNHAVPSSHGLVRLAALPLTLVEVFLLVLLLPVALVGRALGRPWTVEARYEGRRYHEARVSGASASRDHARRLAEEIARGEWPRRNIGRLAIGDDGSVPTARPPE